MRFGGYVLEVLVNNVPLTERIVKVETKVRKNQNIKINK